MKPHGLIIIGDSEQARLYKKALDGAGFLVQVVTTGSRAQVQLTFTAPDLIVLDMHLPDIPGEVVLRQIRSSQRLSGTCLILLSANPAHSQTGVSPREYLLDRTASAAELASMAEGLKRQSIHVPHDG